MMICLSLLLLRSSVSLSLKNLIIMWLGVSLLEFISLGVFLLSLFIFILIKFQKFPTIISSNNSLCLHPHIPSSSWASQDEFVSLLNGVPLVPGVLFTYLKSFLKNIYLLFGCGGSSLWCTGFL